MWARLLHVEDLPECDRNYERSVKKLNLDRLELTKHAAMFPTFGGALNMDRFALTTEGHQVLKNILRIVAHDYHFIEYCPMLPAIVALLLHHLPPNEALGATRILLKTSSESETIMFFPVTFQNGLLLFNAFSDLYQKQAPKIYKHLKSLDPSSDSPVGMKILSSMMSDVLSMPSLFRMLDAFLFEGYKVLFRFAISLLILKGPVILQQKNVADVDDCLENNTFTFDDDDRLCKTAFNISFSRSHVKKYYDKNKNLVIDDDLSSPSTSPTHERMLPNLDQPSHIVKDDHWPYILSWIPKRLRYLDLFLTFSTEINGYSLKTMYRTCGDEEPQLLIVETTENAIFGAYLSDAWSSNPSNGRFFGNSHSFLFTLSPSENMYQWVGMQVKPDDPPEKMKNISENASLFMLGTNQYFAVGGGGLKFGFSIDETLGKGTTGTCLTFQNPPLTGNNREVFEVRRLEIFRFA